MSLLQSACRDLPGLAVVAGAILVAFASARPEAGGWNDGSRLATVESLVERHTLAIDDSIFVQVPPMEPGQPSPYRGDIYGLREWGTYDKLLINGHYYSDKSPVPSLLLAVEYQLWHWTTGLTARDDPDWFCFLMTFGSSGLAYVVAVVSTYLLGRRLELGAALSAGLAASLGLSSVALPYCQYVNSHIFMLGLASLLLLGLTRLDGSSPGSLRRLLGLGTLTGLAYTMDLGVGPVLLVCIVALMAHRGGTSGRRRAIVFPACLLLGALPWIGLHHAVNYAVGGTLIPANAVPDYLSWPESPFTGQAMTGGWKHDGPLDLARYSFDLLAGRRGFLVHDLPLLVAVPAGALLLWWRVPEWPELLFCGVWAGGTWMLYATNSHNTSGSCCSVRWFVPLLAPGYFTLAVSLKHLPGLTRDFAIASGWGLVLGVLMTRSGPWAPVLPAALYVVVAAALGHWIVDRFRVRPVATVAQVRLADASSRFSAAA